jgi:hypothetical protein
MHRTFGESDGETGGGEKTDSQGESPQPVTELYCGRSVDGKLFLAITVLTGDFWVSLMINIVNDVNLTLGKFDFVNTTY